MFSLKKIGVFLLFLLILSSFRLFEHTVKAEHAVGIEPGDITCYDFSGNWPYPNITNFDCIEFTITDVSSTWVSGNWSLIYQNGTEYKDTRGWTLVDPKFGYQWWFYFQFFIPIELGVNDKTGSVYEYVQQFLYFDLIINQTIQEEWHGCLRDIFLVNRTWAVADWTHTVTAKYDMLSGIAYSLYESITRGGYTYYIHLTLMNTTCELSDASPPSLTGISYSPQTPTPDDAVSVSVKATDPCSGVSSVILIYSTNGGESWTETTMTSGNDAYTATIPKQEDGTTVQFKISAEDNAGNSIESEVLSYTVRAPAPPIPGFPLEATLMGIAVATVALTLFKRKHS